MQLQSDDEISAVCGSKFGKFRENVGDPSQFTHYMHLFSTLCSYCFISNTTALISSKLAFLAHVFGEGILQTFDVHIGTRRIFSKGGQIRRSAGRPEVSQRIRGLGAEPPEADNVLKIMHKYFVY